MARVYKYGTDYFQAYRTAYPEMYLPVAGGNSGEWGDASFRPDVVLSLTVASSTASLLLRQVYVQRSYFHSR